MSSNDFENSVYFVGTEIKKETLVGEIFQRIWRVLKIFRKCREITICL